MSIFNNLPIQNKKIKQSDDDSKIRPIYTIDIYNKLDESLNDSYVISKLGDRFDLLADQFYNDQTLWDVLVIHNPEAFNGSMFIEAGLTLRIPASPYNYNSQNRNFNDNR